MRTRPRATTRAARCAHRHAYTRVRMQGGMRMRTCTARAHEATQDPCTTTGRGHDAARAAPSPWRMQSGCEAQPVHTKLIVSPTAMLSAALSPPAGRDGVGLGRVARAHGIGDAGAPRNGGHGQHSESDESAPESHWRGRARSNLLTSYSAARHTNTDSGTGRMTCHRRALAAWPTADHRSTQPSRGDQQMLLHIFATQFTSP